MLLANTEVMTLKICPGPKLTRRQLSHYLNVLKLHDGYDESVHLYICIESWPLQGKESACKPWHNLSNQQLQPICQETLFVQDLHGSHQERQEPGNIWLSAQVVQGAAFEGASHLLIEGTTYALSSFFLSILATLII